MPISEELIRGVFGLAGIILAGGVASIRELVLKKREANRVRTPPRASLASLSTVPGRMRVLVLEDDEATARLNAHLIAELGVEVDVAHSAEEAHALFDLGYTYSLVVGDLGLPDADGEEVLAELREKQRLRILVYTGLDSHALNMMRARLRPDACVEKPNAASMVLAADFLLDKKK